MATVSNKKFREWALQTRDKGVFVVTAIERRTNEQLTFWNSDFGLNDELADLWARRFAERTLSVYRSVSILPRHGECMASILLPRGRSNEEFVVMVGFSSKVIVGLGFWSSKTKESDVAAVMRSRMLSFPLA